MQAKLPQVREYPANWPLPSVTLTGGIDTGIERVDLAQGLADQQRFVETMPTRVNIGFQVSVPVFHEWAVWMNYYGYQRWFQIPMVAGTNGKLPDGIYWVRLLSPLNQRPIGAAVLEVTAEAECFPDRTQSA